MIIPIFIPGFSLLKELVSGKNKPGYFCVNKQPAQTSNYRTRRPPEVHPYRCGFDEVAALHRFRFVSKEKPLGAGHGGAEDSMEGSMVLWLKI